MRGGALRALLVGLFWRSDSMEQDEVLRVFRQARQAARDKIVEDVARTQDPINRARANFAGVFQAVEAINGDLEPEAAPIEVRFEKPDLKVANAPVKWTFRAHRPGYAALEVRCQAQGQHLMIQQQDEWMATDVDGAADLIARSFGPFFA